MTEDQAKSIEHYFSAGYLVFINQINVIDMDKTSQGAIFYRQDHLRRPLAKVSLDVVDILPR